MSVSNDRTLPKWWSEVARADPSVQ